MTSDYSSTKSFDLLLRRRMNNRYLFLFLIQISTADMRLTDKVLYNLSFSFFHSKWHAFHMISFFFHSLFEQQISMQQQIVWSMNLSNDNPKTDCFSYIVQHCNFCIENVGLVAKKVLCKPWSILSKRKKKKQVNID